MPFQNLIEYFTKPFKLEILDPYIKNSNLKVLDVGCGNHSPAITKKYYPKCLYYGLDKSPDYCLDESDFQLMENFFQMDLLNISRFSQIPDEFFDCIIFSHVIEHLIHGEDVLFQLAQKLKSGGIIYLEFPSAHSTKLPSMRGTLNFYDDDTHVRLYKIHEVASILSVNDFRVIKSGIRRSWKRIFFLPIYMLYSLYKLKFITAYVFWDITGFASFVVARKN